MKALVIGSGGREHALAWKLAQCPSVERVYAAPGNPGIAQVAECLPVADPAGYLAAAQANDVNLTVVGPEVPLVAGVVDLFRTNRMSIVGPTQAAARLEGSKAFSKAFMERAGIPTAESVTVGTPEEARAAMDRFGYPVVLKADGLAAGKGVIIAENKTQAEGAIEQLMTGQRLVIEQFLRGEEVSFIVLSDGKTAVPLQPTQDHKQVWDGDRGPNTGGMGAYCDSHILTERETRTIMSTIIQPTIERMASEGSPFTGFLYAGLMMTDDGAKVLEYNVRLGDPETQPLMFRIENDFASVLAAAARGDLTHAKLIWRNDPSVCVVLTAQGYPGTVTTGDVITGIPEAQQTGAVVFQAGTKKTEKGIETAGGRVLGVTAAGENLAVAIRHAYSAVTQIRFRGMHFRNDIGAKGLRKAGTW